jgi:hypothetical protein
MLNVAIEYRKAINDITANKSLKLRQYELDNEGWEIIGDLLRVLKVISFIYRKLVLMLHQMYKDATLFFSQDTVATIAHVIPTMDRIDAMLRSSSTEPLSLSVKHALSFAKQIIDKYYSKMDLSNIYRIAMGMVLMVSELMPCLILITFQFFTHS